LARVVVTDPLSGREPESSLAGLAAGLVFTSMPATAAARDSTAPRATLLFIHPPKTGGSTIGSLFQPRRRLYDVLARPEVAGGSILYHGGHRSSAELAAKCDVEQECCAWLMSFREPLARLRSAFATSVEDHQHFDCPRGSRLRRWLRRAALSLERFARLPAAERRACGLNVYLDLLAPPLGRRDTEAARLQRALARVAQLPLVALTEEFSRSLALLDAALDLRLGHFPAVYTYNPRDSRAAANLSARAVRPSLPAVSFFLPLPPPSASRPEGTQAETGTGPDCSTPLCAGARPLLRPAARPAALRGGGATLRRAVAEAVWRRAGRRLARRGRQRAALPVRVGARALLGQAVDEPPGLVRAGGPARAAAPRLRACQPLFGCGGRRPPRARPRVVAAAAPAACRLGQRHGRRDRPHVADRRGGDVELVAARQAQGQAAAPALCSAVLRRPAARSRRQRRGARGKAEAGRCSGEEGRRWGCPLRWRFVGRSRCGRGGLACQAPVEWERKKTEIPNEGWDL